MGNSDKLSIYLRAETQNTVVGEKPIPSSVELRIRGGRVVERLVAARQDFPVRTIGNEVGGVMCILVTTGR